MPSSGLVPRDQLGRGCQKSLPSGVAQEYVELEGIEPSSAEGLQPALRPFPCSRRYGYLIAGSNEPKPNRRIFLRCQRSFSPSVVFPYGPPTLLLPGCDGQAPRGITARDDSLLPD